MTDIDRPATRGTCLSAVVVKTINGGHDGPRQLGPARTRESLEDVDVVAVDSDDVVNKGVVAVLLAGPGRDVAEVVDVAGRLVEQCVGNSCTTIHIQVTTTLRIVRIIRMLIYHM